MSMKRDYLFAGVVLTIGLITLSFPVRSAASDAPSAQVCQQRVNDTSAKLLECIQQQSLWQHLTQFQTISDANPGSDGHGNRNTGTLGYKQSVQYVAGLMRKAGYTVTIQTYNYTTAEVTGVPQFQTSAGTYVREQDWYLARLSGGGTLTEAVQPATGSGAGCVAGDFAGFVPGSIALLSRGNCAYDVQVANATVAGAAGVVLYNTQQNGNGFALPVRLIHPASIPIISASYAVGSNLSRLYASGQAPTAHLDVRTQPQSRQDYNLIADSPYGDPNHVVVIEGHLDAIYGAGMLDNASGSTTILEIALNMANTPTTNQLRYIWFGGEEIGLLGSAYYTQHLTSAEKSVISFDVDADVTATPNYDYLIADPKYAYNSNQFPPNVIPQSQLGNQFLKSFFDSMGVPVRPSSFGNSGTDSNSFSLIGIPNTGVLTEQDCCKDQSEVNIWGGDLGNYEGNIPSYDGGCVDYPNRWCDNLDNNDPAVLQLMSQATAYVTQQLANYTFPAAQGQAQDGSGK
jgi:hypothetical protein